MDSKISFRIERMERPDKTPGEFLVDGVHYCFTIEDPVRDKNHDGDLDDAGEAKVYGDTAINYGRYQMKITLSPSFHKETIQLFNVKGGNIKFGDKSIDLCGVRLHGGNTKLDSLGCPILGASRLPNLDVYNCKGVNDVLFEMVRTEIAAGRECFLDIVQKPNFTA